MKKETFVISWKYELDWSGKNWSKHEITVKATDERIDKFTDWVNEKFYGKDKRRSIVIRVEKVVYFMFQFA